VEAIAVAELFEELRAKPAYTLREIRKL